MLTKANLNATGEEIALPRNEFKNIDKINKDKCNNIFVVSFTLFSAVTCFIFHHKFMYIINQQLTK